MNLIARSFITICAVSTITACQGQNPFKRESNPVRNYPKVNDSIVKHDGVAPYGVKQEKLPEPDNSQYICSGPFIVSVKNSTLETDRVLQFMDDSEMNYEISITNRLGDNFTITPTGFPKEARFRLLKKESDSTAIYQISWHPKIPQGEAALSKTVGLSLSSQALTKHCQGAIATQPFTLLALKSKERPVTTVTGLPQTPITFGQNVDFQVEVTDRLAVPANAPFLKGFEFSGLAQNGEKLVIDGSLAVSNCDVNPSYDSQSQRFKFKCTFYSSLLEKGPDKALINSEKLVEAVFFVSATSKANGRDSNSARGAVKIQFNKEAK